MRESSRRSMRKRKRLGAAEESYTGAYILAGGIFAVAALGLYFMIRGA